MISLQSLLTRKCGGLLIGEWAVPLWDLMNIILLVQEVLSS